MHGKRFDVPAHDVIRAPGFDRAAAKLGVSPRTWDELLWPTEDRIARDPLAFPRGEGTPLRVAPLLLPDGRWAAVHYSVGESGRPGEALCVLEDVMIPDRAVAP